mmetsp:Transcript_26330/g.39108  ORF Transcript_26330/g.39108 Transcript_26330/m.39108 type:complete len:875 (-) Transcript_26330:267-2891(-)
MPQTITKSWVFLLFLLLSLLSRNDKCCYGLEASFTPASEDNGGGPLPLSQNQRNELLQLEQAITSSPNPQETLAHVASQNGMSADELYNLLVRNRQDMEMAGGGGGGAGGQTEAMKRHAGSSLPRKILGLFYGIIGIMIRYAQKHPRGFGMFMAVLLSVLYYIIMAPRTGLVLSTSTNLLSNGHTTLLAPPTQYLTNYLSSLQAEDSLPMGTKAGFSHKYISFMEKEMEEEQDDTIVLMNKLPKKSNVATIFTGQKFIPSNIIMPPSSKNDNSNDEDTLKQTMASHLIFNAASQIFTTKRFSEFKPPDASSVAQSLRFHTKNDAALLVLKQMGNYRRFGIQPLQLTHEEYDDNRECMVFSTLTGGHFDGELCVWITKNDDDDEEEEDYETQQMDVLLPTRIHLQDVSTFVSYYAKSDVQREDMDDLIYNVYTLWGKECSRVLDMVRDDNDTTTSNVVSEEEVVSSGPEKEDAVKQSSSKRKNKHSSRTLRRQQQRNKKRSSHDEDVSSLSGSDMSHHHASSSRRYHYSRSGSSSSSWKKKWDARRHRPAATSSTAPTTSSTTKTHNYTPMEYLQQKRKLKAVQAILPKGASSATNTTSGRRAFFFNPKSDEPVTLDKVLDIDIHDLWCEATIARSYHELSTSLHALLSSSSSNSSTTSTATKQRKWSTLPLKYLYHAIQLCSEITVPLSYLLSEDLNDIEEEDINRVNVASGFMPSSRKETNKRLFILDCHRKEAEWLTLQIRIMASESWFGLGRCFKYLGDEVFVNGSNNGGGGMTLDLLQDVVKDEEEKEEDFTLMQTFLHGFSKGEGKEELTPLGCYTHSIHLLDLQFSSSSSPNNMKFKKQDKGSGKSKDEEEDDDDFYSDFDFFNEDTC